MAKSRTRDQYEEDADRIWKRYIVPGTLKDIKAAKDDDELRSAIVKKVWASPRLGERRGKAIADKFLDFIVERAYKEPTDGQGNPFLQFRETDIRKGQRMAHISDTVERAKIYKNIQTSQARLQRKILEKYLAEGEKKQTVKRKAVKATVTKRAIGGQGVIKYAAAAERGGVYAPRGFAMQLKKDTMRVQGTKQKMAVSRAMKGPTTPHRSAVNVQNYGAHLRRSAVSSQSNKTASILKRLSKLETKTRKKPLAAYK